MSQFDYLSIFTSIIIALGVSHLISSAARLVDLRDRIRIHAPTALWMVTLLLLQAQIWWVAFYRRGIEHWTFFGYLLYLLIPIGASLLGYLLVPALRHDTDLEKVFQKNRRWFFGLLAAMVVVSLLEDWTISGVSRFDLNAGFRYILLLLSIAGYFRRSKRSHLVIALTFLTLFLVYTVLCFWRI